jgi:hypothetical protein
MTRSGAVAASSSAAADSKRGGQADSHLPSSDPPITQDHMSGSWNFGCRPSAPLDVAIHNGTRREWTALFNPTNGTLMEVHHVVEIGV